MRRMAHPDSLNGYVDRIHVVDTPEQVRDIVVAYHRKAESDK